MELMEHVASFAKSEQNRAEAAVESLAVRIREDDNLAEVTHDARNMVTALYLYCDLLREPGVLSKPFLHYGDELRLVAAASRRLVEKLSSIEKSDAPSGSTELIKAAQCVAGEVGRGSRLPASKWHSIPAVPTSNFAEDLLANRNLLAALAGHTVTLTMDVEGGAQPVRLSGEDLTRILVNLVKNAVEAMSSVGRIHISLWESAAESGTASWLTLNVEDNGPGIPERVFEKIFEPVEKPREGLAASNWPTRHHGLGLPITRSLVEAAGGRISAGNRDPVGACIQIELPVDERTPDAGKNLPLN